MADRKHDILASDTVDCHKDGDTRRANITAAMKCSRCGTLLTEKTATNYGLLHLSVSLGEFMGL